MQEKNKGADYIIKKIHVKPINVTLKHEANSLKIFPDIETPTFFRQDDPQKAINIGQTNTLKTWKGLLNTL